MFWKSLCTVAVLGMCSVLHGAVALNQDFEGFTVGSLGSTGQGLETTVGGKWYAVGAATDPSIVVDPCDPDNLCARISFEGASLKARSTAAPIQTGTPFIVSFDEFGQRFFSDGFENQGSFYFYCDNTSYINPLASQFGIAFYPSTNNYAWIFDGEMDTWHTIGLDLSQSRQSWGSIKLHIKTWNDGIYGRYDVWYNANRGDGWVKVAYNNPFSPSMLHNGVNAVYFKPRIPPASGISNYFDNVYITTEPLDCQDNILFNGEMAGDYNCDCKVDGNDLRLFTSNWLDIKNSNIVWDHKWDCNEMPGDAEGGNYWQAVGGTVADGIYTSPNPAGARPVKAGLYDCNYPAMFEFRQKPITVWEGNMWTNMLVVFDADIQSYLVAHFRAGRYPANAEGWTTFRMVSFMNDEDNIDHGELYYLDQNGKWVLGTYISLSLSGNLNSSFYFGSGGTGVGGDWQEDWFHFTQDQAQIDKFLIEMMLQKIDAEGDGVNFKDFCAISAHWLDVF